MNCPTCQAKSRVTRTAGTIRYRACPKGHTFKTTEIECATWDSSLIKAEPTADYLKAFDRPESRSSIEDLIREIVREELGNGNDA